MNDIVGIIFVIESALESNPILILNDIFGVFLVVGDLDESSLPASVLFMMSSVFRYLSIVAFVVLVEPTIVIALGGKLGIVELFVIVADSVHVFGGIGDLGVVRRGLVRGRITMQFVLDLVLLILLVIVLTVDFDECVGSWHRHLGKFSSRHAAKKGQNSNT